MASRKNSVWAVLERLGHKGSRDDTIQHVFEMASRVTVRSDSGEQIDGDDFLVEVFESLGSTKDWPACGDPAWCRLRLQALTIVVSRLGREGLLDCLSVGSEGTPTPSDTETGKPMDATDGDKDDGGLNAGEGESERETPADDGKNPDRRIGVEVGRALIRRCRRNPNGWSRCVERITPYLVLMQWAKETCPGVPTESLTELMDGLRVVRWFDDDGHIIGGEMLRTLESELEAGRGHEQWMLVVSDFETAIQRLRSVFEKLSLL